MACLCILGGISWHISCGFVVSSSYRLKLWLQFPQPDCPIKSVHTLIVLPLGFLFLFCSFFFFFSLLLSHLTHKRHKSRRGRVFTARQFLQHQGWVQGMGWKTCYPHTHTHTDTHTCLLALGRWAPCQRCLFILALGALICTLSMGESPPSHTAPGPEHGLASSRTSQRLLQGVTCWLTSLLMALPGSWQGPSLLSRLWEIWEGARERADQVKATKPGKCSHVPLEGEFDPAGANAAPCYSVMTASSL